MRGLPGPERVPALERRQSARMRYSV